MNIKQAFNFLAITIFVSCISCKPTKEASSGTVNFNLSKNQLIRANNNAIPKFKTLQSRVKVEYIKDDKSQSYTVTLRMLKDQVIWINSALNVMRVKITPENVSFYNKWDNTYFDGDFSLLSDFLGTELDFNKVQNLVLGETLFKLNTSDYVMSMHQQSYLIQPETQLDIFEIFYLLNPTHFKLDSQQLAQPKEARLLQIDYLSYQTIDKKVFPKNLKINALEGDEETILQLEFKSMSLNEDLRFPFKIPSGFDQIVL